jgi:hypothetical protein
VLLWSVSRECVLLIAETLQLRTQDEMSARHLRTEPQLSAQGRLKKQIDDNTSAVCTFLSQQLLLAQIALVLVFSLQPTL